MNSQDFAFWLQGYIELSPEGIPSPEQWTMIKEHLALVFDKQTPELMVPAKRPTTDDNEPPKTTEEITKAIRDFVEDQKDKPSKSRHIWTHPFEHVPQLPSHYYDHPSPKVAC